MKICLYWYSATGNTKNLARAAKERWRQAAVEVVTFDMLNRNNFPVPKPDDFDLLVFAFPVMYFTYPLAVKNFLETLPKANKPIPAHLLVTSGGMGAKTDSDIEEILSQKGIPLASAQEFFCIDSYIPFRKYLHFLSEKSAPNDRTRTAAEKWAELVLENPHGKTRRHWRGLGRSFWSFVGRKMDQSQAKGALGPRRLSQTLCNGCGICVKLCPSGALTMVGKHPSANEGKCIGCCACFNNCRPHAWRLKRYSIKHHYLMNEEEVWRDL